MRTAPALDALLARVYRHFPRDIDYYDPRHETSEPSRRLACVHEAAAIACGKGIVAVPDEQRVPIDPEVQEVIDALRAWRQFGERCKQAFPDREVWDESGPFFDPGYRYAVAQAGYVIPRLREPRPPDWDHPDFVDDDDCDPVICVVSVLAPVFAILTLVRIPDKYPRVVYADFPERYHDRIEPLSALAAEVFGFARLDVDALLTPIPDVHPHPGHRPMTETTLADCLFTTYY